MKYKREPELEAIADLADQFSYFIAGVILLSETAAAHPAASRRGIQGAAAWKRNQVILIQT